MADGAAAGFFGFGPTEGDGLVVEVNDAWLAGWTGRLCKTTEFVRVKLPLLQGFLLVWDT